MTDINLPGCSSGLDLASQVSERWPEVRLLIVSGQVRPPRRRLSRKGGLLHQALGPRRPGFDDPQRGLGANGLTGGHRRFFLLVDERPLPGGSAVRYRSPVTNPLAILKETFGFPDFRGVQRQVVERVMAGSTRWR